MHRLKNMSFRGGAKPRRGNPHLTSAQKTKTGNSGNLEGIATSHFVLLAMTRVLITAPLNDHLYCILPSILSAEKAAVKVDIFE